MRVGMNCPVCGQEDCGLHDSALAFAHLLDVCAHVLTVLLTGLIALAVALAKA
jgi:hypothetical protein